MWTEASVRRDAGKTKLWFLTRVLLLSAYLVLQIALL